MSCECATNGASESAEMISNNERNMWISGIRRERQVNTVEVRDKHRIFSKNVRFQEIS